MPDCTIRLWIDEETVTGNIGHDWSYSVIARVFNPVPKLISAGELRQPVHRLDPGTSQAPPNPKKIKLPAGECGTSASLMLKLTATENDWLTDDTGSNELLIAVECPGPGQPPVVREVEVKVHVAESSRLVAFFTGDAAADLTIKMKLEASCR